MTMQIYAVECSLASGKVYPQLYSNRYPNLWRSLRCNWEIKYRAVEEKGIIKMPRLGNKEKELQLSFHITATT